MSVVVAPSPEEKATPCSADSSEASARLQRVPRRVRDARVVVALVLADRVLDVRRRLVDRRDDRAGRRIRLLAVVDGARLEVHQVDANQRSRSSRGSARSSFFWPRFPPDSLDVEPAGLAVEDRLDPADEPVAVEDGEDVVAVLALRRRHVHLEPVEEVPERLGAGAVVDEPVEGREERDALGNRAVLGLRVRHEPAALAAARRARGSASRRRAFAPVRAAGSRSRGTSARRDPRRAACLAARRPPTSPRAARSSSIRPIWRWPHQRWSSRRWLGASAISRERSGPRSRSSFRTWRR